MKFVKNSNNPRNFCNNVTEAKKQALTLGFIDFIEL